jgi:O-methyltransferase involved in polyketide biosynthesis
VAEPLLLPLYIRALESQRPDALLKDDKAVALVKQMNYDSSWMTKMRVDEEDKVALVLRNREFDRFAQDFLPETLRWWLSISAAVSMRASSAWIMAGWN